MVTLKEKTCLTHRGQDERKQSCHWMKMINIFNLKSLRNTNMKVVWANLRVFFKELQFKDVMNSWKVKELVFLLLVLWLALMFPRVIPPRSTNNRGLPLQSSCPAYVNILFWSRTKYWKLESFFPLEPKLQVWEITVLSLLSEVSQMLNWDYIKCKFYFFLVR